MNTHQRTTVAATTGATSYTHNFDGNAHLNNNSLRRNAETRRLANTRSAHVKQQQQQHQQLTDDDKIISSVHGANRLVDKYSPHSNPQKVSYVRRRKQGNTCFCITTYDYYYVEASEVEGQRKQLTDGKTKDATTAAAAADQVKQLKCTDEMVPGTSKCEKINVPRDDDVTGNLLCSSSTSSSCSIVESFCSSLVSGHQSSHGCTRQKTLHGEASDEGGGGERIKNKSKQHHGAASSDEEEEESREKKDASLHPVNVNNSNHNNCNNKCMNHCKRSSVMHSVNNSDQSPLHRPRFHCTDKERRNKTSATGSYETNLSADGRQMHLLLSSEKDANISVTRKIEEKIEKDDKKSLSIASSLPIHVTSTFTRVSKVTSSSSSPGHALPYETSRRDEKAFSFTSYPELCVTCSSSLSSTSSSSSCLLCLTSNSTLPYNERRKESPVKVHTGQHEQHEGEKEYAKRQEKKQKEKQHQRHQHQHQELEDSSELRIKDRSNDAVKASRASSLSSSSSTSSSSSSSPSRRSSSLTTCSRERTQESHTQAAAAAAAAVSHEKGEDEDEERDGEKRHKGHSLSTRSGMDCVHEETLTDTKRSGGAKMCPKCFTFPPPPPSPVDAKTTATNSYDHSEMQLHSYNLHKQLHLHQQEQEQREESIETRRHQLYSHHAKEKSTDSQVEGNSTTGVSESKEKIVKSKHAPCHHHHVKTSSSPCSSSCLSPAPPNLSINLINCALLSQREGNLCHRRHTRTHQCYQCTINPQNDNHSAQCECTKIGGNENENYSGAESERETRVKMMRRENQDEQEEEEEDKEEEHEEEEKEEEEDDGDDDEDEQGDLSEDDQSHDEFDEDEYYDQDDEWNDEDDECCTLQQDTITQSEGKIDESTVTEDEQKHQLKEENKSLKEEKEESLSKQSEKIKRKQQSHETLGHVDDCAQCNVSKFSPGGAAAGIFTYTHLDKKSSQETIRSKVNCRRCISSASHIDLQHGNRVHGHRSLSGEPRCTKVSRKSGLKMPHSVEREKVQEDSRKKESSSQKIRASRSIESSQERTDQEASISRRRVNSLSRERITCKYRDEDESKRCIICHRTSNHSSSHASERHSYNPRHESSHCDHRGESNNNSCSCSRGKSQLEEEEEEEEGEATVAKATRHSKGNSPLRSHLTKQSKWSMEGGEEKEEKEKKEKLSQGHEESLRKKGKATSTSDITRINCLADEVKAQFSIELSTEHAIASMVSTHSERMKEKKEERDERCHRRSIDSCMSNRPSFKEETSMQIAFDQLKESCVKSINNKHISRATDVANNDKSTRIPMSKPLLRVPNDTRAPNAKYQGEVITDEDEKVSSVVIHNGKREENKCSCDHQSHHCISSSSYSLHLQESQQHQQRAASCFMGDSVTKENDSPQHLPSDLCNCRCTCQPIDLLPLTASCVDTNYSGEEEVKKNKKQLAEGESVHDEHTTRQTEENKEDTSLVNVHQADCGTLKQVNVVRDDEKVSASVTSVNTLVNTAEAEAEAEAISAKSRQKEEEEEAHLVDHACHCKAPYDHYKGNLTSESDDECDIEYDERDAKRKKKKCHHRVNCHQSHQQLGHLGHRHYQCQDEKLHFDSECASLDAVTAAGARAIAQSNDMSEKEKKEASHQQQHPHQHEHENTWNVTNARSTLRRKNKTALVAGRSGTSTGIGTGTSTSTVVVEGSVNSPQRFARDQGELETRRSINSAQGTKSVAGNISTTSRLNGASASKLNIENEQSISPLVNVHESGRKEHSKRDILKQVHSVDEDESNFPCGDGSFCALTSTGHQVKYSSEQEAAAAARVKAKARTTSYREAEEKVSAIKSTVKLEGREEKHFLQRKIENVWNVHYYERAAAAAAGNIVPSSIDDMTIEVTTSTGEKILNDHRHAIRDGRQGELSEEASQSPRNWPAGYDEKKQSTSQGQLISASNDESSLSPTVAVFTPPPPPPSSTDFGVSMNTVVSEEETVTVSQLPPPPSPLIGATCNALEAAAAGAANAFDWRINGLTSEHITVSAEGRSSSNGQTYMIPVDQDSWQFKYKSMNDVPQARVSNLVPFDDYDDEYGADDCCYDPSTAWKKAEKKRMKAEAAAAAAIAKKEKKNKKKSGKNVKGYDAYGKSTYNSYYYSSYRDNMANSSKCHHLYPDYAYGSSPYPPPGASSYSASNDCISCACGPKNTSASSKVYKKKRKSNFIPFYSSCCRCSSAASYIRPDSAISSTAFLDRPATNSAYATSYSINPLSDASTLHRNTSYGLTSVTTAAAGVMDASVGGGGEAAAAAGGGGGEARGGERGREREEKDRVQAANDEERVNESKSKTSHFVPSAGPGDSISVTAAAVAAASMAAGTSSSAESTCDITIGRSKMIQSAASFSRICTDVSSTSPGSCHNNKYTLNNTLDRTSVQCASKKVNCTSTCTSGGTNGGQTDTISTGLISTTITLEDSIDYNEDANALACIASPLDVDAESKCKLISSSTSSLCSTSASESTIATNKMLNLLYKMKHDLITPGTSPYSMDKIAESADAGNSDVERAVDSIDALNGTSKLTLITAPAASTAAAAAAAAIRGNSCSGCDFHRDSNNFPRQKSSAQVTTDASHGDTFVCPETCKHVICSSDRSQGKVSDEKDVTTSRRLQHNPSDLMQLHSSSSEAGNTETVGYTDVTLLRPSSHTTSITECSSSLSSCHLPEPAYPPPYYASSSNLNTDCHVNHHLPSSLSTSVNILHTSCSLSLEQVNVLTGNQANNTLDTSNERKLCGEENKLNSPLNSLSCTSSCKSCQLNTTDSIAQATQLNNSSMLSSFFDEKNIEFIDEHTHRYKYSSKDDDETLAKVNIATNTVTTNAACKSQVQPVPLNSHQRICVRRRSLSGDESINNDAAQAKARAPEGEEEESSLISSNASHTSPASLPASLVYSSTRATKHQEAVEGKYVEKGKSMVKNESNKHIESDETSRNTQADDSSPHHQAPSVYFSRENLNF